MDVVLENDELVVKIKSKGAVLVGPHQSHSQRTLMFRRRAIQPTGRFHLTDKLLHIKIRVLRGGVTLIGI